MGQNGLYKTVLHCCMQVFVEAAPLLGGQTVLPYMVELNPFGRCLCVWIAGRGTMNFSSMRAGKKIRVRELLVARRAAIPPRE